jgi:hypothetical protein
MLCCAVPRGVINEVADEKGCSSVLFFEARKRQDLYLWMVSCQLLRHNCMYISVFLDLGFTDCAVAVDVWFDETSSKVPVSMG